MATGTIVKSVGKYYEASKDNITRSTTSIDTYTLGASVSLPAGLYMIIGSWTFSTSADVNTARNCQVCIGDNSTTGGVYTRTRVFMARSNWARLQTMVIKEFTAQTTVYVKGSASMVTATDKDNCEIRAVRLA